MGLPGPDVFQAAALDRCSGHIGRAAQAQHPLDHRVVRTQVFAQLGQ
jgi:hypothetical protein